MKKLVVVILAAVLALSICAAAFANDTAAELYDKTVDLLFNTSNVTLKADAEFSLDGEWFKTVNGVWKQDGKRSYRQLDLTSPKNDGTERHNGYKLVMDGYHIYTMEVFTPGVYRTGMATERNSLLHSTVETRQLIGLGSALASQADLLLGKDAVTKSEDGTYRISLGEDTPAMANAVLNELARFAAKRYFGIDYDQIGANNAASLYNYGTMTQAILFTMQRVSMRKAEITLKTDKNGDLQQAEGTIGLYLETAWGGIHQLDISFRAEISDRGSTMLKKFNPDDYGVVLASDDEGIYGEEAGSEITEYNSRGNEALIDQMSLEAMRIWQETGFNTVSATGIGCYMEDYRYEVIIDCGNGAVSLKSHFTLDGTFTDIEAEPAEWKEHSEDLYVFDPTPDPELDKQAKEFMMTFLRDINYERAEDVKDFRMQWMCELDGSTFALYEDNPPDQEGKGVSIVIRLSPEMRIESYSCVTNG